MKINWSGLADEKYYEYIAKYCLPSWKKLPGEKFIVHDSDVITHEHLTVVPWKNVANFESDYWVKYNKSKKKTNNFY